MTLRLTDCTPAQRRLILALLTAKEAADTRKAAAESQIPATAKEARRAAGERPAAA